MAFAGFWYTLHMSLFSHLPAASLDGDALSIVVFDSRSASCSTRALSAAFDGLGAASAHAQRLPAPITSTQRVAADVSQRAYIALDESGRPLGFLKVGVRTLYLALPARAAFGRFPDPGALVGAARAAGARDAGARRVGGAGSMWECAPLCVLDFFVAEGERRRGVGRALMDSVLRSEGVPHPAVLAFVSGFRAPRKRGGGAAGSPAYRTTHALMRARARLPPPPSPSQDRPSRMFLAFLQRHFGLREFVPQTNNFVLFDAFFDGVLSGEWGAATTALPPQPQPSQLRAPPPPTPQPLPQAQYPAHWQQPSPQRPPSQQQSSLLSQQQQQQQQQQMPLRPSSMPSAAWRPLQAGSDPQPSAGAAGAGGSWGLRATPQQQVAPMPQQQAPLRGGTPLAGAAPAALPTPFGAARGAPVGAWGGFSGGGGGGGGGAGAQQPPSAPTDDAGTLADHFRVLRMAGGGGPPPGAAAARAGAAAAWGASPAARAPPGGGRNGAPGAGHQWTGGGGEGSPLDLARVFAAPDPRTSGSGGGCGIEVPDALRGSTLDLETRGSTVALARKARLALGRPASDPYLAPAVGAAGFSPTRLRDRPF